jgi:hypothetical protein
MDKRTVWDAVGVAVGVALVLLLAWASAARLGPTDHERCLDAGAAGWNGTPSELWAECSEQVRP